MAIPNYVQPGSLIRAEFMNSLIDELKDLDARVTALSQIVPGGQGELAITSISPSNPHTGDVIYITGVNFGVSQQGTVVTFNGANAVRNFPSPPNSDQLLILNVPAFSFQGNSVPVDVGVSNGAGGFDHRQITVQKPTPTIPQATLPVIQTAWPQTPNSLIPAAGGTFVFPFQVQAIAANMDYTYDVQANLPSGWSWDLTADPSGNNVVAKQVFLPQPSAGNPIPTQMLYIKTTIPPTQSGTAVNITVAIGAQAFGKTFGSTSISFTIGKVFPGVSTIAFAQPVPRGPGGKVTGNNTIAFTAPTPPGSLDQITMQAQNLKAGNYTASIAWPSGQNGWAATLGVDPTNPLMTNDFQQSTDGGATTPIVLAAATGATAAQLVFTIEAQSPGTDIGSVTLSVQPA